MIYAKEIPAPKSRYMPKAHSDFLSRALTLAWAHYEATQFPQAERDAVGEAVAADLERRNPAADMDVLQRYGLTEMAGGFSRYDVDEAGNPKEGAQRQRVNVSTFNAHSGDWQGVGVEIPRAVRIASRSNGLRANARAARKPAPYGVTPENEARHKAEGTWAEVVANNESYFDGLERDSLPAECDSFFARVMDLRKAYREQYQGIHRYLDSYRAQTKPTWAEIEKAFPFLGEYLAHVRAGAVAEAA